MANLFAKNIPRGCSKTNDELLLPPVKSNSCYKTKKDYIFEGKQIENYSLLVKNIKLFVEQMEKYFEAKNHEKVLELGHKTQRLFRSLKQNDLNGSDILSLQGCMLMLLCKSEMENNNHPTVIENATALINIAHKMDNPEFHIDVNNIIAQAYIKAKNYHKAAASWQTNLKLARNQSEKSFFYHEIGRCYYQLNEYLEARLFGMWSLTEAFATRNNWWCLNAAILVAQSETLLGFNQEALESFLEAEKYACIEKKQDIIDFIQSQKKMFLDSMVAKPFGNTN